MSTPSMLQRLGSKARDLKSKVDFLPGESEFQGIKATQANVDQATQKPDPPKEEAAPDNAPVDRLHPMKRYGSEPGEQRIETKDMTKPLGSIVPTYDKGGDVKPG